jgi:hypothetical protein
MRRAALVLLGFVACCAAPASDDGRLSFQTVFPDADWCGVTTTEADAAPTRVAVVAVNEAGQAQGGAAFSGASLVGASRWQWEGGGRRGVAVGGADLAGGAPDVRVETWESIDASMFRTERIVDDVTHAGSSREMWRYEEGVVADYQREVSDAGAVVETVRCVTVIDETAALSDPETRTCSTTTPSDVLTERSTITYDSRGLRVAERVDAEQVEIGLLDGSSQGWERDETWIWTADGTEVTWVGSEGEGGTWTFASLEDALANFGRRERTTLVVSEPLRVLRTTARGVASTATWRAVPCDDPGLPGLPDGVVPDVGG